MGRNKTSDGLAEKGSKLWMQKIVNPSEFKNTPEYPNLLRFKENLEDELKIEKQDWISPLARENYHEYRLNETKRRNIRSEILNLKGFDYKNAFKFWPSQGHPVWDAIALSKDNKELFLFEAKAHIKETYTKCNATSRESIKLIKESMGEAYKYYSKSKTVDEDKLDKMWMQNYYQLGNRLTFIYYMNKDLKKIKIEHTTLVLLNIVDDKFGKTDKKTWEDHYRRVFNEMIGYEEPPEDVKEDVKIVYIPD